MSYSKFVQGILGTLNGTANVVNLESLEDSSGETFALSLDSNKSVPGRMELERNMGNSWSCSFNPYLGDEHPSEGSV